MMHLLTPEEYAQIADALDNGLPEVRQSALAMLKAMKPAEIEAYLVYDPAACSEDLFFDGELGDIEGKTVTPLYAKEQQ